jgi:hypothetical protein
LYVGVNFMKIFFKRYFQFLFVLLGFAVHDFSHMLFGLLFYKCCSYFCCIGGYCVWLGRGDC